MTFLDRMRLAYRTIVEPRAITLADFPQLMDVSSHSATGITVSEQSALSWAPFWNGVNIIASQIASLPRIVYKRLPDDERERAVTHPAYKLLHGQPNRYSTGVVTWETIVAHTLTWGNGYAEIEWDGANRPIGIWPITPNKMQPVIEGGRLWYRYNGSKLVKPEDFLHIPGLGWDGLQGYSVITMARQSIGLGLAAERFGANFFGNGALPGAVAHHPGVLSAAAKANISQSWEAMHRGVDRAHKIAIFEEGMKIEKIGIPPDDAQFLQTREFSVLEAARWLNIPPRKLKLHSGEAPTTPEAGQIDFLTDTLRPWLVRIEEEINRKLLGDGFYVEHKVDAILRMDGKSRAQSYKAYLDMGVLNKFQIAKMENFPAPAPDPEPKPAPPLVPPPGGNDEEMNQAQRALVVDVVSRFVRREGAKLRAVTRKGPGALATWLEEFYAAETPVLRGYLLAAVRIRMAHAGAGGDPGAVAAELAQRYVARSRDELLALPARGLEDAAVRLVTGWETTRPLAVADELLALNFGGSNGTGTQSN